MATITRGYTFGATEQVTNTKLHTLVDSATISSIGQGDFGSGVGLISRGTSAPSDSDQLWIDTSLTPPILRVNDGSNWVPVGEWNVLTNKSGQSMSVGHVVIIDTDNSESVEFTSSAGSNLFRGISMATIANNSSGVFISKGYVPVVTLEISASAGCGLRTSTATGKAEPVAFTSSGVWGVVTTPGTASAGAYLWGTPVTSFTPSASNALAGSMVQMIKAIDNNSATGTGTIDWDDSIPQNTEGTQFLSAGITPFSATNRLIIEVITYLSNDATAANHIVSALFQDSNANALAAGVFSKSTLNDLCYPVKIFHEMAAGTKASSAFKVRCGGNSASKTTFNGESTNRKLGGVLNSAITIYEIKV